MVLLHLKALPSWPVPPVPGLGAGAAAGVPIVSTPDGSAGSPTCLYSATGWLQFSPAQIPLPWVILGSYVYLVPLFDPYLEAPLTHP